MALRFHGRARIGMPVTVSQHTYISTFDVASAQRGWESWLAGVFAQAKRPTPADLGGRLKRAVTRQVRRPALKKP
jgi:hypothetical protein